MYSLNEIKNKRLLRQAENIMQNFDFERVAKVMKFLDWGWCVNFDEATGNVVCEIPNIYRIIRFAESLLAEVAIKYDSNKQAYSLDSGGFIASITSEGDLKLIFYIENFEEYVDDYDENGKLKNEE